jgi:hypothetical protein
MRFADLALAGCLRQSIRLTSFALRVDFVQLSPLRCDSLLLGSCLASQAVARTHFLNDIPFGGQSNLCAHRSG